MASLLIIEHRDGRQYAVSAADFRKQYEAEGFRAVAFEDGAEYEPPAPRKAAEKPADEQKDGE